MEINITARKISISSDLKVYIEEKLHKLSKYDKNISKVDIILLKESRAEKVELIVSSNKKTYITKCYSSVFEKTITKAIQNIIIQIKKNK